MALDFIPIKIRRQSHGSTTANKANALGQQERCSSSLVAMLLIASDLQRKEMTVRKTWILLLSFVVSSSGADESLWGKLQQDSNMIVLMRNTESSGNRNGVNMLDWDASGKCKGESTLTEEGKAHARKIGAAFTKYDIKPKVISSPMCRCTEAAEISFGEYLSDPDLRQRSAEDSYGQDSFQVKVSELLSMHRGSAPIAFVNHRPNIDLLTMELIDIGDLLIGTVSETGEIEIFGKIRVEP